MNPKFSTPGFQPNPCAVYHVSHNLLDPDTSLSYLHALVLGGRTRLGELEEFALTPEFSIQAKLRTANGYSALELAALNCGRPDSSNRAVELLLPVSDGHGTAPHTALMLSAGNLGSSSTAVAFRMLLSGMDPNLKSSSGWTALMIMCKHCQKEEFDEEFKLLLDRSDANLCVNGRLSNNRSGASEMVPLNALSMALVHCVNPSSERRLHWLISATRFSSDSPSLVPLRCAPNNTTSDAVVHRILRKTLEPLSDEARVHALDYVPLRRLSRLYLEQANRLSERATLRQAQLDKSSFFTATVATFI